MGVFAEAGVDWAGAEGDAVDAEVAQFDAERFGEAGDVGFCGRVDREVGDGQGGGERADVEDIAAAVRDHLWQDVMGDVGERFDIEAEHGFDARPLGGCEIAVVADACVIDEAVDVEVFLFDAFEKGGDL